MEQIHHCRACGEGFCDDCSERCAPVPERGWGDSPVRVCDHCYEEKTQTGMAYQALPYLIIRVGIFGNN